eukprot:Colp12_sorted_trinity150504_noHs@3810
MVRGILTAARSRKAALDLAAKVMSYYSVQIGRKPGVYRTWAECEAQVKGYPGAKHKKFATLQEAQKHAFGSATTPVGTLQASQPAFEEPPLKRVKIEER